MRVVAAPDKFRGTATADEVAVAVADGARLAGWDCDRRPLADGGEGTLAALGGGNRTSTVSDPAGDVVEATWRLSHREAVIEMAAASGLAVAGGPEVNDPVAASTYGTGEIIAAAVDAGARRVLVGMGGSATTDGGLGALRALYPLPRYRSIELVVACDTRTRFTDAAERFGPQKGASDAQVALLTRRLERLAQVYEEDHGVDVRDLQGAGAAGGLAGGLAAIGSELIGGFEVVAEEVGLFEVLAGADLVVTGEGFCDQESFSGKVVGGVVEAAADAGVPCLVVAGQVFDEVGARVPMVSLVERFGAQRAFAEPLACVTEVITDHLRQQGPMAAQA